MPAEGLEPTRPCGKCHAERSRGISQFFCEHTNELTFSNIQRPTSNVQRSIKTLPADGLEPTRPCGHWILSPARLPIPPRRLCNTSILTVRRGASEPAPGLTSDKFERSQAARRSENFAKNYRIANRQRESQQVGWSCRCVFSD